MPNIIKFAVVAGLTVNSLLFSPAVPAMPSEFGDDLAANGKLTEVLASVDDDAGIPAVEGLIERAEDTSFSAEDGSGTEISVGEFGSVSFSASGNPGFSLSFADATGPLEQLEHAGPLAYDAGPEAKIVPQIVERHFRGLLVLDSPVSSSEFTFQLAGREGAFPSISEDGGIVISNDHGELIGGFMPPWAKDSSNRQVPTHYIVNGQTVRQVIDTSSLSESDYPVVADPATYVNVTKRTVINSKNHGNVAKWKYLNACTSTSKNKPCSVSRSYTVTGTVQTALNMSASAIGSSLGISISQGVSLTVSCGVSSGPGTATLYASANKITYQVKSVRTYGVAPQYKYETKTSGVLTAYKPNGKYLCA